MKNVQFMYSSHTGCATGVGWVHLDCLNNACTSGSFLASLHKSTFFCFCVYTCSVHRTCILYCMQNLTSMQGLTSPENVKCLPLLSTH
jgi:hypothetical protein